MEVKPLISECIVPPPRHGMAEFDESSLGYFLNVATAFMPVVNAAAVTHPFVPRVKVLLGLMTWPLLRIPADHRGQSDSIPVIAPNFSLRQVFP
jgi:hypothetical protein